MYAIVSLIICNYVFRLAEATIVLTIVVFVHHSKIRNVAISCLQKPQTARGTCRKYLLVETFRDSMLSLFALGSDVAGPFTR